MAEQQPVPGRWRRRDGCERVSANGVVAERVVNTWPVERLLDWTRTAEGR